MFGPLPALHKLLFIVVSLAVCVGAGAWLAYMTPVPMVAASGAAVGAVAGAVLVFALLHSSHPGNQH